MQNVRTMYRGTTYQFLVSVTNVPVGSPPGSAGSGQDITGWTFTCTGKMFLGDSDMNAVWVLTSTPTNGIVPQSPLSAGKVLVTIPASATSQQNGRFGTGRTVVPYVVVGKDASGEVFVVEDGDFIVKAQPADVSY